MVTRYPVSCSNRNDPDTSRAGHRGGADERHRLQVRDQVRARASLILLVLGRLISVVKRGLGAVHRTIKVFSVVKRGLVTVYHINCTWRVCGGVVLKRHPRPPRSREQMEEMCKDIFERAIEPVRQSFYYWKRLLGNIYNSKYLLL